MAITINHQTNDLSATSGSVTLDGNALGASGGVFYENSTTVSSDYTITASKNAVSAGPVTIANGVTVTVPSGSRWAVV